ncbi:hypothetical protein RhiJN_27008 [Ceratobasidium sp. AG-Ba]|nr:hypothetical protein RhiJN_27008 [Ceratobasidium sp. AG-Ba]
MKFYILFTLICAGSATKFTTLEDDDASAGDGFFNQLGIKNSPRFEALKAASHAATAALEKQAEIAKARLLVEAQKLVEKAKDNLRAEVVMDYFESLGEDENENDNSDEGK